MNPLSAWHFLLSCTLVLSKPDKHGCSWAMASGEPAAGPFIFDCQGAPGARKRSRVRRHSRPAFFMNSSAPPVSGRVSGAGTRSPSDRCFILESPFSSKHRRFLFHSVNRRNALPRLAISREVTNSSRFRSGATPHYSSDSGWHANCIPAIRNSTRITYWRHYAKFRTKAQ